MKIITISGLDGSGKSTQINFLKEYLESQGLKVFYFHVIRFGIANRILALKKKYCIICKIKKCCKIHTLNAKDSEQKSVIKSSWLGVQLRRIALGIDMWRFKLLRNKLSSKGYDYILSDRYFYDTIVNINYLSKKPVKCKYSIDHPNIAIYLKTDPEAIMTRSKRVPDQGLNFLQDKKKILDKKTGTWNWTIIDNTDKNKFETFEEIKKVVEK
jgi:thymidylate kinase